MTNRTVHANGMPVSIDAFENDAIHEPTASEQVIAYLVRNDDKAFTRGEIAADVEADADAVGSALTRLKDRGLVRHRQHYWTVTDDRDRLRAAVDLHRLLESLAAEEDESFDREAWLADATPVPARHGEDDPDGNG